MKKFISLYLRKFHIPHLSPVSSSSKYDILWSVWCEVPVNFWTQTFLLKLGKGKFVRLTDRKFYQLFFLIFKVTPVAIQRVFCSQRCQNFVFKRKSLDFLRLYATKFFHKDWVFPFHFLIQAIVGKDFGPNFLNSSISWLYYWEFERILRGFAAYFVFGSSSHSKFSHQFKNTTWSFRIPQGIRRMEGVFFSLLVSPQ